MNDILYKDLIVGWIPFKERKILTTHDMWLIGLKYLENCKLRNVLLADIAIHTGVICNKKVCICKYFPIEDKINAYNNGLRYLPFIF